ncbi:MAG: hypothetical protein ABIK07_06545 [Planctomycetota bacterium]|jgi:hypothetical protein
MAWLKWFNHPISGDLFSFCRLIGRKEKKNEQETEMSEITSRH